MFYFILFLGTVEQGFPNLCATDWGRFGPVRNRAALQAVVSWNVMRLNHPETIPYPTPRPWKNCLPQNRSLVPKRLGTAAIDNLIFHRLYFDGIAVHFK